MFVRLRRGMPDVQNRGDDVDDDGEGCYSW
jgi:hypothetical protein